MRTDGEADSGRGPLATLRWYRALPAASLQHRLPGVTRLSLHRFTGIDPVIVQPALREHVAAVHLGGAKRVTRWHAGRRSVTDVEPGSITLMPAFQANRWMTEGPVDFAHVVLEPALLARLAVEELGRDPRDAAVLIGRVGATDPVLSGLFQILLHDSGTGVTPTRLYADSFATLFGLALLRGHTPLAPLAPAGPPARRGGLAEWQLQRVLDRMEAALREDVPLAELVGLTGLSRSQFFRGFRQSTGATPHRYLTILRMERAKLLLRGGLEPEAVAAATGYTDAGRFATAFRRYAGVSPRRLRCAAE